MFYSYLVGGFTAISIAVMIASLQSLKAVQANPIESLRYE